MEERQVEIISYVSHMQIDNLLLVKRGPYTNHAQEKAKVQVNNGHCYEGDNNENGGWEIYILEKSGRNSGNDEFNGDSGIISCG